MKFHEDGTSPKDMCSIFVFGSNLAGIHGAGAAKAAYDKFGASWGKGIGMMWSSYAIPTKDSKINSMSLLEIKPYIEDFVNFAKNNKHLQFWLTSIGTGLAGNSIRDISTMFYPPIENISYPDTWEAIFEECFLDSK